MKLLYLANGIGQLWLLDLFLGFQRSYQLYGIHVLAKFLRGEDWSSSERFPRVTLCDFEVWIELLKLFIFTYPFPLNLKQFYKNDYAITDFFGNEHSNSFSNDR